MKIDRKTVTYLETLARIELGEAERDRLAGQLDRIVEFVEKLNELDAADPTGEIARDDRGPARGDEPVRWLDHGDALEQAPDAVDGYYRVPPVIDRGEDG